MDTDTVADALGVLRALPEWRLPAPRWEQVRLHLDRIAVGLDGGDPVEVREAVADLRLCAPKRIDPIKGKSGAPDEVLDRIAPLVHSLQQPRSGTKPGKEKPAGAAEPR
ncbi:CATRA system-associated protein [Actinoplanes sp. NPDC051513]|uniref:CATRA system-associated protein n=1 Tax=Actinoplanes sp. NPDC051513 TaxID=3363908 RepID=UPI0037B0A1D1